MSENAQPKPDVWPECSTCETPYVLRRAFTFPGGEAEWIWQRDCRHKGDPVLAGAVPARIEEP